RHTTTWRELVPLPRGGLLIDSPGLRELQLWAEGSDVDGAFTDIAELAARCAFSDCSHTHEPRCAVQQAIADGLLAADRFESFEKLARELEYQASRDDPRLARERKERGRRLIRAHEKQHRKEQRRRNDR